MWHNKKVVVVFPAYNEEENIGQAVADFRSIEAVDQVIVVDNNSVDRTGERAAAAGGYVVKELTQGYGAALIRGLKEAKKANADLIILAEPDGTFSSRDILKLLAYESDFDLVCGTRTTKELIWENANMGWILRIGNIVVAKALEFLYSGPSLSDCGCTLRLIHSAALERILDKLTVTNSHFLPEMVILSLEAKLRVIEIPVNYGSRIGVSKITGTLQGTFKTGMRMIGLIIGYKFRR